MACLTVRVVEVAKRRPVTNGLNKTNKNEIIIYSTYILSFLEENRMKVIFDKSTIISAVAPLMCAVSGKSVLSTIEGILIEAKSPDVCVLTTYDLDKGVRTEVEAKVIEEGSFIINAQKFNQTLKVMGGDEITLTVDEKMVACISCG